MNVTEKLTARLPKIGDRGGNAPVVAVVKLHGMITPTQSPLARGVVNLAAVETALTSAFDRDRLVAVALSINSPGGAATQSAMIAERIRQLAGKRQVPVLAFCEDLAASGGYYLACAADEIYAHRSSMVGSIGVISSSFGLSGLIDRLGVERRVYTAGEHKHRLDPFQPEKAEDVAWLEGMQSQVHEVFVDWVRERRGDQLAADEQLFTGEVWTGARALELGLLDGLGTLREVVATRFPEAEVVTAEPKRPLLAKLGFAPGGGMGTFAGERLGAAITALEQRAAWSRFGL
ncbi:signal peptide peptidase SppA [Tamaricihabitans halophyticus]|uniref:Signal peptide peptidase SppA n=1 Tax=Tamaricihabitans halophyticus TaxID=1262583 RepID=A0A4R2R302_9PSEU|nr:S49 family peptidase [Tamaricihabitans halophyticus]TCP57162.1 signal peptide peptidase SppA [Tamaricihabitans halophyticus]